MRIGMGCELSDLPLLASEKYDYIEARFVYLAKLSEKETADLSRECEKVGIYAEAVNNFFPGDVDFYSENADLSAIEAYVRAGMKNATALGCKIAVIGSGKARNIPDFLDKETAIERFCRVVRLSADIADEYGVKIAVEPLNREETNFINTVEDGVSLCRRLNLPSVGCLADFYHMYRNDEPADAVLAAKGRLIHTHFARPAADRFAPRPGDVDTCRLWAEKLKECGYADRITLECCREKSLAEELISAREAISVFRAL